MSTDPLSEVPESCPFTIQRIQFNGVSNANSYLIREHDRYGEFPHIYAKICGIAQTRSRSLPENARNTDGKSGRTAAGVGDNDEDEQVEYKVIILSDTGCGTEVPNATFKRPLMKGGHSEPEVWNIRTFLEYTLNPGGRIPYLIMTTHCHYDHILGIGKMPPTSPALESLFLQTDQKRMPESADSERRMGTQETSKRRYPPTTVLTSSYEKSFVTPYSNLQSHSLCDMI